jgi:hypothetical protein
MDSWFNDPFFDHTSHRPSDIHRHFADMERRMNNMMGSMFSGFGFDEQPNAQLEDNHTTRHRPHVEEISDSTDAPRPSQCSRSHPIIEEPDDVSPKQSQHHPNGPQTVFYSSSATSYSGSDGVTHAKRKTYNSATGKTEFAEIRKLGDKAVGVKREIDANGRVNDEMTHQNMDESELNEFNRKWDKRQTRSLTNSGHSQPTKAVTHRRALK